MRTAFLAAAKRTSAGDVRALSVLGGRSILAWQVELARKLGCERIICFCDAPGSELLALQRRVEADGGEFHAIRGNLQLVSLLRADDELLILLDGLFADDAIASALASSETGSVGLLRKGIATIAADHPLAKSNADDFERIDKDRHWAGFAVIRAAQAQKLADLPADSDAMSSLLRIALQARVECFELPASASEQGSWLLASDRASLAQAETRLIAAHAGVPSWAGPSQALAASILREMTPRGLENGPESSAVVAIALTVCGVSLAAFGLGSWGLAVAGLGAFAGALSGTWGKLRAALWSHRADGLRDRVLGAGIDAAAIAGLVLTLGIAIKPIALLALPAIAVGLARALGASGEGALSAFWRDRGVHLLGFAVGAGLGILSELLALFALGAVLQLLLRTNRI